MIGHKQRVAISLTTNPLRIWRLRPTLESLCSQSLRPDVVYLNLPFEHQRFVGRPFTVPNYLANFSECLHVSFTEDFGPATKLLGALPHEADPQTLILVVDDDKAYARGMLGALVQSAQERPDAAIGFAGISVTRGAFCFEPVCEASPLNPVAILEGFAGVLYRRRSVGPLHEVRKMVRAAPRTCQLGDDVLLSNWLSMRGVPRLRLYTEALHQFNLLQGGYEDDSALHNMREGGKQGRVFHPEEMRKYRPCFRSGAAASVEQESQARMSRSQPAGCSRACHRFNRSSACEDMKRSRACEAASWQAELQRSERLLRMPHRPDSEALRASAGQLLRDVRHTTAHAGSEVYATVFVNTRGTDYLPGLLALATTLADSEATRPLVVLLVGPRSAAISRAAKCLNFTVASLNPIENVGPIRRRSAQARFNDTFSKLYAFGMNAERVVLLDADTLVLSNIDELFRLPGSELAAVPDFGYACGNNRRCRSMFAQGEDFNSGVMVLRPSQDLFEQLYTERWSTDSNDGGDQGFLNAFFRARRTGGRGLPAEDTLPAKYNTFAQEELLQAGFRCAERLQKPPALAYRA